MQRTSGATRRLDWNDVASCGAAALGLDVLEDMRKALTGKRMTREIVEGVLKKSIKKSSHSAVRCRRSFDYCC